MVIYLVKALTHGKMEGTYSYHIERLSIVYKLRWRLLCTLRITGLRYINHIVTKTEVYIYVITCLRVLYQIYNHQARGL